MLKPDLLQFCVLPDIGAMEMWLLGERFRQRFPELLEACHINQLCYFRSTQVRDSCSNLALRDCHENGAHTALDY